MVEGPFVTCLQIDRNNRDSMVIHGVEIRSLSAIDKNGNSIIIRVLLLVL